MADLKSVLIIDDEPGVRRTLTAYLADSGYQVFEASNGMEGLSVFARTKPDIVLTDLHMPQIDGLELIDQVKRASPATPVIVITGTGDPNALTEARCRGAAMCIVKPVGDLEDLVTAIDQALTPTG